MYICICSVFSFCFFRFFFLSFCVKLFLFIFGSALVVWVVWGYLWSLFFVSSCFLWGPPCCSKHDVVTVLAPQNSNAVIKKGILGFLGKRAFGEETWISPQTPQRRGFRLTPFKNNQNKGKRWVKILAQFDVKTWPSFSANFGSATWQGSQLTFCSVLLGEWECFFFLALLTWPES